MNKKIIFITIIICIISPVNVSYAEQKGKYIPFDQLLNTSLKELMDVNINIASRSDEKQFKSAAAVYVLTSEDIRRSGHRRLAEILRLIPGVNVAKQDANKWAVSIRNSQTRFSSTLLVMVDGRHVYSPFYAGVYWENVDTFIEDIDRIEVVRGPGGALWGANAVDGIINIITKSSADTYGSLAYGIAGVGEMNGEAGFRYGGVTKNGANFRIYGKGYNTDTGDYMGADESTNNGIVTIGDDSNDQGVSRQAGVRVDWISSKNIFSMQGSFFNGRFEEDRLVAGNQISSEILTDGHNGSFKWERLFSDKESILVNTFYNQITRDNSVLFNDEATFEIDLQHNFTIKKQYITWGVGYQYYRNRTSLNDIASCAVIACFSVDPAGKDLTTWSAFAQDKISFSESFSLIVGSKFEHNDYTGFEYQPTLRGLWTPDDNTTYWAAATRAVRVPDRVTTEGVVNLGGPTTPIGSKDQESYLNYTYEIGLRKNLYNTWIIDSTLFHSNYDNTVQNFVISAVDTVYGFEGYIKYQYSPELRLDLGYTYTKGDMENMGSGNTDLTRLPQHTAKFRSYYNLRNDMDLDLFIYHVDESEGDAGLPTISAYTRIDLRYGWRPIKRMELSILITNMIDDVHAEAGDQLKINSGVERGAMLKLTYKINN